jgi:hypothetical protein
MSNQKISSKDFERMRALKANDWRSPMSEEEKDFVENMERIIEGRKAIIEGRVELSPKEMKKFVELYEKFGRMCQMIMAEVDKEKEARDALASGTHYIFDRVQISRHIHPKEIDRLLNKRGRRPEEDLQFEERVGDRLEIVVLRQK